MRLFPNKTYCLILDFVDNCARNPPITIPSLLGLDPDLTMKNTLVSAESEVVMEKEQTQLPQDDGDGVSPDLFHAIIKRDKWDLFKEQPGSKFMKYQNMIERTSPLAWVTLETDEFVLNLFNNQYIKLQRNPKSALFEAHVFDRKSAKMYRFKVPFDPTESLDGAVKAVDTYVTNTTGSGKGHWRTAAWRQRPASEAQVRYAKRLGAKILEPAFETDGDGSFNIDEWLTGLTAGEMERLLTLLRFGKGKKMLAHLLPKRESKNRSSFESALPGPLVKSDQ